jgi:phosphoribosyl-ATP pyrophosphohydrolase/phosphoribosyl-AMP cyclohydrolase
MLNLESLSYDENGLIPVIAQDAKTKQVLMLGYASLETLRESIQLGKLVFFSRSRNQRWLKGETSGNYLHIESLDQDCDSDAILALVHPQGPTCHTGSTSCFGASDA